MKLTAPGQTIPEITVWLEGLRDLGVCRVAELERGPDGDVIKKKRQTHLIDPRKINVFSDPTKEDGR